MAPPLINEYKRGFILKRLVDTFLGGLRLATPLIFIIIQIIIFYIPSFVVCLVNLVPSYLDLKLKSIVTGCSLLIVDVCLALIILLLKRRRYNVSQVGPVPRVHIIGAGESDGESRRIEDEGNNNSFLAQEDVISSEGCFHPSTWVFIAPNASFSIRYTVAIVLSSASVGICTPLMISETIPSIVRVLAIIAVSVARYSSVINAPFEVANFDTSDKRHVLFRPFYTTLIGSCYAVFVQISHDHDESLVISSFSGVLASLPLLWGLGILPPLEALFPWTLETVLVLVGGVSPSYYYVGTFVSLIVIILCPILVFIITQEPLMIILAECVSGYIISCDTGRLISVKPALCEEIPTKSFLRLLLHPSLNVIISLLSILLTWTCLNEGSTFVYQVSFAITTITITLVSWAFRYFTIGQHTVKKVVLIPMHILHKLLTFLLHIWLTLSIEHEKSEWSSVRISVSYSLGRLVPYLLTIRAFALAVSEPRKSSIDFCVAFLFRSYLIEEKSSIVLVLFITSLVTSRIKRGLKVFKTVCSIFYAFAISTILDSYKLTAAASALLLMPLSFVSLMVTILIDGTTLIPLFTLPIFLLGFPRPISFWKDKWFIKSKGKKGHLDVENIDCKIYSEIGPLLASSLCRKAYSTKLELKRGDCFLARYEDRLLFIRIVSSGWNFAYLQIKGLEMQEQTSCHHQEAAKVDEIFEEAFSSSKSTLKKLSTDILSLLSLLPLCTLKLPTYSESKANISCLFKTEEKLTFKDMFYRAFSYLWIKNNPALKGDSYQKGIQRLGIASKKNRLSSTFPKIDSDSVDSNPITHSADFSLGTALFKSTKLTVDFINTVEPKLVSPKPKSPQQLPQNLMQNIEADDSNTNMMLEDEENEMSRKESIFSQQSTSSTLVSPKGHNRRMSMSNGTRITEGNNTHAGIHSSDRLSSIWIKQCVGDVLPSNAVKARVEKMCKGVWDTVFGLDDDEEIDLSEFFHENFLQKLKNLSTSRRLDMELLTLKALRYASKLGLDEIYSSLNYASTSAVITIDSDTEEEIFTQLTLFERDYQFCTPQEIPYWIEQNSNHIITITKVNTDTTHQGNQSVMRILNYESEGVEFRIGELDQFTVEGVWSNLNLELLYLTSDDDERFSIQNDRVLLRNLITQCAKSPLGYPVYDAVFRVNLHTFTVTQTE